MNLTRRKFFSMLGGTAGAVLVPWRGLTHPVISLPGIPDFTTDDLIYRGCERYSAGWTDVRGFYGSTDAESNIVPYGRPVVDIEEIARKHHEALRASMRETFERAGAQAYTRADYGKARYLASDRQWYVKPDIEQSIKRIEVGKRHWWKA